MLKRIWEAICRTHLAPLRHEAAARGPPTAAEELNLRRVRAWMSLNELAESVWRFLNQDYQSEQGVLSAFQRELVSRQLSLWQAIDDVHQRDPSETGRLLGQSGKTIRWAAAAAQALADLNEEETSNRQRGRERDMSVAKRRNAFRQHATEAEITELTRETPPQPIPEKLIETETKLMEWNRRGREWAEGFERQLYHPKS